MGSVVPIGEAWEQKCFEYLDFFQIWGDLYIHKGIWVWAPRLSTNFISVSYATYAHSWRLILYNIFSVSAFRL
jgi:hypothetical protein